MNPSHSDGFHSSSNCANRIETSPFVAAKKTRKHGIGLVKKKELNVTIFCMRLCILFTGLLIYKRLCVVNCVRCLFTEYYFFFCVTLFAPSSTLTNLSCEGYESYSLQWWDNFMQEIP